MTPGNSSVTSDLLTDGIELGIAIATVLQLEVHGVAEQGQATPRPQQALGLLQEARPVEPVGRRHGRHQVRGAVLKGQLLRWTLPGKCRGEDSSTLPNGEVIYHINAMGQTYD